MQIRLKSLFVLSALLLSPCFAATTSAQVVYNNGKFLHGPIAGGDVLSDARAPLQAADDFVLASGATSFSKILWWGTIGSGGSAPGDFMVEIYLDDPISPGQPDAFPILSFDSRVNPTSRITTTKTLAGTFPIYRYRMKIPPTSLPAGTRFWISVYKTGTAGTPWFFMSKSSLAGDLHIRPFLHNGIWYPGSFALATGELAFQLRK